MGISFFFNIHLSGISSLILYTDGLNEAKDATNSNFGKTRIMEVMRL